MAPVHMQALDEVMAEIAILASDAEQEGQQSEVHTAGAKLPIPASPNEP